MGAVLIRALRQGQWFILTCLALALGWEALGRSRVLPKLLFPSFGESLAWLGANLGDIAISALYSLQVLGTGLGLAILLAFPLAGATVVSRPVREIMSTLVALFNPLPTIAILPLALLWFGLHPRSIVFVIFLAGFWPFLMNVQTSFSTVSRTILEVGRNYGLSGVRLVLYVFIPAALPGIITGFRIAWAVSWRTAIAAELVYGAIGIQGGIGWYIYVARFLLTPEGMMAGILTVATLGFAIENLLLECLERYTVVRWGMKRR